MLNPQMAEFNGRVKRIQKARAKGYGFEAVGTLGRSFYTKRGAPRRPATPIIKPLLIVLACAFGLKGTIHYQIGGEVYESRVASLKAGEGFDRLGGYLMQADPVTEFVSAQLRDNIGTSI